MGNTITAWRISIGLFNSSTCICTSKSVSLVLASLFLYLFYSLLKYSVGLILLLAGDIESNPGPVVSSDHSLSIIHCNIRSIRTKMEFIKNNYIDFDIMCFTETHLDDNITLDSISIPDRYDSPLRKDRTNHGGGILIYLASNLKYKRRNDLEHFWNESIWVEIKTKHDVYCLGVFYSPRRADQYFVNQLNLNIEKVYENTKNIIIVGDLNEDLLNPNMYHLRNFLLLNPKINIISEPTRQQAILDPIIIPDDMEYLDSGIIVNTADISDHNATYILLPYHYEAQSSFERKVWLYKRANFDLLSQYIDLFDWTCLLSGTVNDACNLFTNKFLEFVEKCIPSKVILVRNDDKPWYDSEIRKYSRIRDRLKTKASKSKNQNDWSKYKRTRNKVNNLKKHAKELFYNNLENILLENSSNNKRDYWRVIRHFVKNNNSKSCIPPMCSPVDNKYSYTDRDIAETLNSFFTSVSKVNDENAILPNFIAKTGSILHSVNVTSDQIEALIKSLNLNKASGPDLISHKMLKGAAKAVSKPLTILFNRSLDESIFPDTWKIANVIPINKSKCQRH